MIIFLAVFLSFCATSAYGMENLLSPQLQAQGELLLKRASEVIPDLMHKASWEDAARALVNYFSPTDPREIAQFWISALEEGPNPCKGKCTDEEREVWLAFIKILLIHTQRHINVFWEGKNALRCALKQENELLVELLLGHGAQVNGSRRENFIPIHEAAQLGNARLVTMLVLYGANVNKLDENGNTILYKLLVQYRRVQDARKREMITLLWNAGAREYSINYNKLSKLIGFNVLTLSDRLPEERKELLSRLSKEKLASLCLLSERYFDFIKEATQQFAMHESGDLSKIVRCGLNKEQLGKWMTNLSLMKVAAVIEHESFFW